MKHDDDKLIERTLEGDDRAFATLVEKYQDQIHALAWQKIGDFHIAQEITQDAFITAYRKLTDLKHPNRFAGWLYVITCNECNMWHRKKKPQLQSFQETDPVELDKVYYTEYVSQQREEETKEKHRVVVQKLLSKLRESERTVVTLHYLADLTCEEIGRFLGVSTNTVKSRLHRARNRLRNEESLIRESLSSFQLSKQLTENIMKEISHLTLPAPSGSKPLIPWLVSGATAILILLLSGVGAQYLYRFQKPYNYDATSEPTIEITDAPQFVDTPEKPALRNRSGRAVVPIKTDSSIQKTDVSLTDSNQTDATKDTKSDNIPKKGTASLTGKVVDKNGKTIPGLELTIKPVIIGTSDQMNDMIPSTPLSSWARAVTDKTGNFTFRNIDPVSSQLVISPETGADFEIISLEIGEMTYYFPGSQSNLPIWFGKPTFAIEPDVPLENIVVTVKPAPRRIRGRILLKDGTPLSNARIGLTVKQRIKDTFLFFFKTGESGSSTGGGFETDSQGYFVSYISGETAEYSVSVRYEGASAKSRWFRVKKGQSYDKLVFRLKDLEKHRKNLRERVNAQQAIWTLNPENGHAYKKILCESWNDAKAKAAAEDAYLVSINDEGEQKWLEARFAENLFYWIGLNTSMQWDSGEPLTYINWSTTEKSNEESTSKSNVPVAMEFYSKRWMAIGSDSPFLPFVKHAIIEKKGMQIISAEKEK